MAAQETVVNEALIDEFQRDGCAVLRGVFAPWIERLKAGVVENMASPSFRERTYVPDDGSARFFQDFCNWSRIAGYRALVMDSPMARIAARLMRSRTARIFHDHVLVKEPGTSVVTPWHQDQPYYLVEGSQSVSFWVPLDPVPRERTIEYVAGSHRWGREFRPERSTAPRSTKATSRSERPMWKPTATSSISAAGRSSPATRWCSAFAPCTARRPTHRRTGAG